MSDKEFMREAIKEAQRAFSENEVPVGAVVVLDGKIIGRGHNKRETNLDISSHAEIEALKDAARTIGSWHLEGASIYVTLEPCLMCSGAIAQARVMNLIYGCDNEDQGAIVSNYFVYNDPHMPFRPLVKTGILEDECRQLLIDFFKSQRKG